MNFDFSDELKLLREQARKVPERALQLEGQLSRSRVNELSPGQRPDNRSFLVQNPGPGL